MTSIEVAQKVREEGVQLFRPTKGTPGQYDCKAFFTGSKRGWVALDSFSASAILAVYNALRPDLQEKYATWSPQRQATFAFKHVK
jgi:hypothetical protein